MAAHGAGWRDCKKAKLRELKLEQAVRSGAPTRKRSGRGKSPRQRAEALDEWLWKNCRVYSYELRKLEQQQM